MKDYLFGCFARWWHCLIFTFYPCINGDHRELTFYDKDSRIICLGCSCGQTFWVDLPAATKQEVNKESS